MRIMLFWLFLGAAGWVVAQPGIQWQSTFGGSNNEEANCIQQTTDGGFILAGVTQSNNGDVSGYHGGGDFWVIKLNNTGAVQWKKPYGGSSLEVANYILQTNDNGFVIAGTTFSNDGDVTGNHGAEDAWIVKLDGNGYIQWQKAFGGSAPDEARSIQQTEDGGFVFAGRSNSLDGDVTSNQGFADFWVVKLNSTGEILWQKSIGGSSTDKARDIKCTPDGGYIVVGESFSNDGHVSGNNGDGDYWVVKLTKTGEIEWQKSLGGLGSDIGISIAVLIAGGYMVLGSSGSGDTGNVMGHHGIIDIWLVKLDNFGGIVWQRPLGGSEPDYGHSIFQTIDGGCIVVGSSQSEDGDVLGNDGGADLWIVKLNGNGEIQWQKTMGGTEAEQGYSIQQTNDNGYISAGFSWSNDGDVSGNHGGKDFWVVKLAPPSTPTTQPNPHSLNLYPNPTTQSITIQIPDIESPLNIQITDLLGCELGRQTIPNGGTVDIESLPNGVYLVSARTDSGEVFLGRVCKQE